MSHPCGLLKIFELKQNRYTAQISFFKYLLLLRKYTRVTNYNANTFKIRIWLFSLMTNRLIMGFRFSINVDKNLKIRTYRSEVIGIKLALFNKG